ncbi:MAG: hypothetical protein NZ735_03990, partial [Candidatus Marinimicrobia bacterium]|nr:hypothetical protein [Candidatus Neomarinimicrobiota bacterium]
YHPVSGGSYAMKCCRSSFHYYLIFLLFITQYATEIEIIITQPISIKAELIKSRAARVREACKDIYQKSPNIKTQNQRQWDMFFRLSEPLFMVIIIPAAKNNPPNPYKYKKGNHE